MADKFDFSRVKKNMERLKVELPVILANQAQNYFVDSWSKQGWEGKTWKTPQRKIPGTNAYKYPKDKGLGRRTRATLVQTGRMRRAVGMSIRAKSFEQIRLVVDLPYAKRHNEGLDGMPKRQFMAQSARLEKLQKEKIVSYIDQIWKD